MVSKYVVIVICALAAVVFANENEPYEINKIYLKVEDGNIFRDADKTKKLLEEELNLYDDGFSCFMLSEFNKSGFYPGRIMSKICKHDPVKGFKWLTTAYDNFNVIGKRNFYGAICRLDFTEIKQILVLLLDDKTGIPAFGREPSPIRVMDDRVCDLAYDSLRNSIYEWSDEKKELFSPQNSINPNTCLEDREKAIFTLKNWWKEHSDEFLKDKASLVENYPELKHTLEELENKIRKQIERQNLKYETIEQTPK